MFLKFYASEMVVFVFREIVSRTPYEYIIIIIIAVIMGIMNIPYIICADESHDNSIKTILDAITKAIK